MKNYNKKVSEKDVPLVSIIILNWNGGNEVIGCIGHALAQTYTSVEILVIDNASTDDSRKSIMRDYPEIQIIENEHNIGYSSGMNQGIMLAKGEYVLLLNQDAWISERYVENAVRAILAASDDVGMISARIYKLDGSRKSDTLIGGGMLLRKRFRLAGDPDTTTMHYTFGPSFCCPFLSKTMLEDIKKKSGHYFDDRYFAYGEDMDLVFRAQLLGWKCLYCPEVVAWHSQSGSLEGKHRLIDKPILIKRNSLRNRYHTLIKDLPIQLIPHLAPYIVLTEIAMWPYFAIKSPTTLLSLMMAYYETLKEIPVNTRLRRRIQSNMVVSSTYIKDFFSIF